MNYRNSIVLLFTLLVALVSCNRQGNYLSPSHIVGGNGKIYIALSQSAGVSVLNDESGEVESTIHLSDNPNALCLDKNELYIACGGANGYVSVISIENQKEIKRFYVGHTPNSILKIGETLYVSNRFSFDVSVIDISSGELVRCINVVREPTAMAVTPNGKYIFVANYLPSCAATESYVSAEVSVIDVQTLQLVANIKLCNGAQSVEDIVISPNGEYAYLTHIVSRYGVPVTQLDRGWVNSNGVSIIDVENQKYLTTVLIDDVDRGAANPKGMAITDSHLYVAVSGTHELLEIDRVKLHNRLNDSVKSFVDESASLSFMNGLKKRYKVASLSPQRVFLTDKALYMSCRYTPTVERFINGEFTTITLGNEPKMNSVRRGELAFNNADICYQGWQSCASCHPDGRADGLNWDQLNDGLGNPKNTKSMLHSHKTPPVMATGIRVSAEIAVRKGILHTLGTLQNEELAKDIDNYLISLKPIPSPYLANGVLSPGAKRGELIFNRAKCIECHNGQFMTNGELYGGFDTPTLIEVWRSAPYLHDGSAVTILDVLKQNNSHDKRGLTSTLSEQELQDLEEYVLSL